MAGPELLQPAPSLVWVGGVARGRFVWREAGEAAWRRRKVQVRTAGAHGSSVLCAVCCVLWHPVLLLIKKPRNGQSQIGWEDEVTQVHSFLVFMDRSPRLPATTVLCGGSDVVLAMWGPVSGPTMAYMPMGRQQSTRKPQAACNREQASPFLLLLPLSLFVSQQCRKYQGCWCGYTGWNFWLVWKTKHP